MKLRPYQIMNCVEPLNDILQQKIPARLAFSVHDLVEQLNPRIKAYQAARLGLFQKYGEQVSDTQWTVKPDSPNLADFQREAAELDNLEVEVEFKPLPRALLDYIQLVPVMVPVIEPFFEAE